MFTPHLQWSEAHPQNQRLVVRREKKRAVTEARNRMFAAHRREAITKLLLVTKSLAGSILSSDDPLFVCSRHPFATGSQRERMLHYKPPEEDEERRHKRKLYLGISEACPPPRKVRAN